MPKDYRTRSLLAEDGTLLLTDLPFHAGEAVEVIVRAEANGTGSKPSYPLRGTPVTYHDPFEPVAEEDWEALG